MAADAALALAGGYPMLFLGIALWGLHMGLTQGILTRMIADVAPQEYRGTAFGMFNLMSGAALLASSAAAGGLWDWQGPAATFWMGAGIAALSVVATPWLAAGEAER